MGWKGVTDEFYVSIAHEEFDVLGTEVCRCSK
jgi:hypothetical protein